MSVGESLRAALHDFYDQSWRLLVLNTALSAAALVVVSLVLYTPLALVLVLVLGPLAAALMHCAVTVVREDELRLREALVGLGLHWRRGLALGALGIAACALTLVAMRFYADAGPLAWPAAVLVLYLAVLFVVYQLPLWPLAVFERDGRCARSWAMRRSRSSAGPPRRSGSRSRSCWSTWPASRRR